MSAKSSKTRLASPKLQRRQALPTELPQQDFQRRATFIRRIRQLAEKADQLLAPQERRFEVPPWRDEKLALWGAIWATEIF